MIRKQHNPFPKAKKLLSIAQFFTGGLDSTYLLYKNLKAGHTVTPHYVEIANNGNKSKIERQQLVKIHALLYKEFPAQLNNPKLITKTEIWKSYDSGLKFAQIPIWLFATNYVDQDVFDEIQMGYVSNDDAVPFVSNMQNFYKAMDWLMYEQYNRPKLTFPLLKQNKYEMLRVLPSNLKELIYSCENPNVSDDFQSNTEESLAWYGNRYSSFLDHDDKFYIFEPCGECDPCSKIMNNQYLYDNYCNYQPIFNKLKVFKTINEYNALMDRARYNDEMKQLVNNYNEKHSSTDVWKQIDHPVDSMKESELIREDSNAVLSITKAVKSSSEIIPVMKSYDHENADSIQKDGTEHLKKVINKIDGNDNFISKNTDNFWEV
jgi:hypothetical protein